MTLDRFTLRRGEVELSGLRGGEGDLVVLLHGLAGSAAEMAPLGEALIAGGKRVVALDQRGHGRSTRRPADLSRPAFVDDVRAVLREDGGEPAWLVGQSMGAHTAMLVTAELEARQEAEQEAQQAAGRPPKGLVMISGGVGGSTEDYPKMLGEWFAGWPVPFADEKAAAAFLGERAISRAWIADFERRPDGLHPRFDADVMEAVMRPVADVARWAEWERITVPTLLIRGADDDDVDAGELNRMAEKARAESVVGAGHDVHLDQPDRTARLIRDFIGG